MSIKNDIFCMAHELGADDIAFVKNEHSPELCNLVLFFKYSAAPKAKKGYMQVSPYYLASHRGYKAAKSLVQYIRSLGSSAQQDTVSDVKHEALKHGGFIGTNGFYYHEQFGSLVHMQLISTDAVKPDETITGTDSCAKCHVCITSCPTNAVGNLKDCLRYHSNLFVPEHLRHGLYQLLGCEKCQTGCPMNNQEKQESPQYKITDLLEGKHTKELKEIAGSNMARKQRIVSQAAIYAANTGYKEALPQLKELAKSAPSPVKEHAEWAANKLEADDEA